MRVLVFFMMFLNMYFTSAAITEDNIVTTSYGAVQGVRDDQEAVVKFLKIPFAEPPVGKRRFARPRRHSGWEGILNATELGQTCLQTDAWNFNFPESEDCLHLNIFVPVSTSNALPVMFYIHGGTYAWGSGVWYDGTALATEHDVIVVTINYRLDLLGFMSSGNFRMPGNMGLFDQLLALKWVNENIGYFGGDAGTLTVVGVSAGADSVLMHVLSPMSRGLFQRAALESPQAQFHLPIRRDQRSVFRDLAVAVNCSHKRTSRIVACMRELPAATFKSEAHRAVLPNIQAELATRVIDGRFIVGDPKALWETGSFTHVDLIIGFNSEDGDVVIQSTMIALGFDWNYILANGLPDIPGHPFLMLDLLTQSAIGFQTRKKTFSFEPLIGASDTVGNTQLLVTMARHEFLREVYADPANKSLELRIAFDVMTGGVFAGYATYIANAMSTHTNKSVYMYYFSYRSPIDVNPAWLLDMGAFHSSEVEYLWGERVLWWNPAEPTEEDLVVSQAMQHAWTSFAKTGTAMIDADTPWPPYSTDGRAFWHFNEASGGQGEPTARVLDATISYFNTIIQPVSALKQSCPR